MNRIFLSLLRPAMACTAIALCMNHAAHAQNAGDYTAQWRFGIFGGAAYNQVEAPIQRYVDIPSDPSFQSRDYSEASSVVPYGGIGAEYLFNQLIGVGLRFVYDDRTVSKDPGGSTFAPHISYIAVEPALRLNINPGLHFNIGPSVNFAIKHTYDYTPAGNEAGGSISDADLRNVEDVSTGIWGGFGYDIPLSSKTSTLHWYLSPFVEGSWLYNQKKADAQDDPGRKWTTLTARAGMQLKFGPAPATVPVATAPPTEPTMNISINTPRRGVLQPRTMIEHLPLVNYVFFDRDSTGIPARYERLQPEIAAGFDERTITQPITAGSTSVSQPEERQMEVYYNMLNIFGSRLTKNADTRITLVGSAPDQKEGLAMAENVKRYLTTTFGISADRIATRGQIRPPHASGTRATPKEDLPLVAEENRRVEILTENQQLLEPVQHEMEMKEPVANNIDIEVIAPVRIATWTVRITGEGYDRTYGPFRAAIGRINATPILGENARGNYKATIVATTDNGGSLTREATFTLRRTERPPVSANRYSILFEYDESKSVEMYERFLRNVVAPSLPEGSMVYVHGHTDVIGDYDYNGELSMNRAMTAMEILEDEIIKLERSMIFDGYGLGEYSEETPFGNESPEERHYNRTVIIDVFEGM